jgi:hypothetical protein
MDSFRELLNEILQNIQANKGEEMLGDSYESTADNELVATFHTRDDGMVVVSMFDIDQWSLISDMAAFMGKSTEDIIEELDPSSPNIMVMKPEDLPNFGEL